MGQTTITFILRRLWAPFSRLYRFIEYHAGVQLGWRDAMIPPAWLHSVGNGNYEETGENFLRYFVERGGLRPDERVLDVGSGTARMARPLTKYLESGSYDGIDVVARSVEWCRKTYAPRYANFRFHHADIYNSVYNPRGRYKASEYRFPFGELSFDFVFLTSVFSHMLPQDMEHYLSEVARVLKPGGRSFITYFLLNPDSLKKIAEGASRFDFSYQLPGCRIQDKDAPEAVVAYDERLIRELYRASGLDICEPIHYGSWCGRKSGLTLQEMIVAVKSTGTPNNGIHPNANNAPSQR